MTSENEALVRGCWEVANTGSVAGFSDYYDRNVAYHGSGEEVQGLENLQAVFQRYMTAFPDLKMTVEDLFASGDRVFSRARFEGTNTGPMMGLPPTGKRVDIRWIMNCARIANGRIVEEWEILDQSQIMRQLGLIPEPAAARGA